MKELLFAKSLLSTEIIVIKCRNYSVSKDGVSYRDEEGYHFINTSNLYFLGVR